MTDKKSSPSRFARLDNSFSKLVAESTGFADLSDDCLSLLAFEADYRLKEVVNQARKYKLHGKSLTLRKDFVDLAIKNLGIEPLLGREIPAFKVVKDLFVKEDKIVDLNEILNAPTPKLPRDIRLRGHWLAVNGVQPAIPENPIILDSDSKTETIKLSSQKGASTSKAGDLDRETNVSAHDLTLEQQFFFKEITEACVGHDEERRMEALNSLTMDTGLQPMLPRLCLFISEGIRCNIVQRNLALLIYLTRMIKALVDNESLDLQKVLHQLMGPVLSCTLGRNLCQRPEQDNHWALRDFAAKLLSSLCKKYSVSSPTLQPRVMRIVLDIWESDSSHILVLYGALCFLADMGHETIASFVLLRIPSLGERLSREKSETVAANSYTERSYVEHFQKTLVKSICNYLRSSKNADDLPKSVNEYRARFGTYLGPLIQQSLRQAPGKKAQTQAASKTQPISVAIGGGNLSFQGKGGPFSTSSSPAGSPSPHRFPSPHHRYSPVVRMQTTTTPSNFSGLGLSSDSPTSQ